MMNTAASTVPAPGRSITTTPMNPATSTSQRRTLTCSFTSSGAITPTSSGTVNSSAVTSASGSMMTA